VRRELGGLHGGHVQEAVHREQRGTGCHSPCPATPRLVSMAWFNHRSDNLYGRCEFPRSI
jgi:hypothetical protein